MNVIYNEFYMSSTTKVIHDVLADLLFPPAERGVVEVGPDADDDPGPVAEEPGHHQQPPPPLARAAQHQQDVDLGIHYIHTTCISIMFMLYIHAKHIYMLTRIETKMLAAISVSRGRESSTCNVIILYRGENGEGEKINCSVRGR